MKLRMVVGREGGDTGEFLGVDEAACTGCGTCARFCAREVWRRDGALFRPARPERCAECGACWNACPSGAVRLGEPRGGTGVRFTHG
jgi:NAD-dependent dihydropyrimidine dehydrogenase PreA subunit